MKTVLLTTIFLILSSLSYGYDEKDLWLLKSYGQYKVKVYRIMGEAHAGDEVQVDIYNVPEDGSQKYLKTIDLDTPGYKGYIDDIKFESSDDRVSIIFYIEMKGLDGAILPEVFVIDKKGNFKKTVEAKGKY